MNNEELRNETARLKGQAAPESAETVYPIPPELREGAQVDAATRAKTLDLYVAAVNTLPAASWSPRQQDLIREHCRNITK